MSQALYEYSGEVGSPSDYEGLAWEGLKRYANPLFTSSQKSELERSADRARQMGLEYCR